MLNGYNYIIIITEMYVKCNVGGELNSTEKATFMMKLRSHVDLFDIKHILIDLGGSHS